MRDTLPDYSKKNFSEEPKNVHKVDTTIKEPKLSIIDDPYNDYEWRYIEITDGLIQLPFKVPHMIHGYIVKIWGGYSVSESSKIFYIVKNTDGFIQCDLMTVMFYIGMIVDIGYMPTIFGEK